MGKYQKNIEAARRITVMQYLETYHPGELVRKTIASTALGRTIA